MSDQKIENAIQEIVNCCLDSSRRTLDEFLEDYNKHV
jgi:hypothetical protein